MTCHASFTQRYLGLSTSCRGIFKQLFPSPAAFVVQAAFYLVQVFFVFSPLSFILALFLLKKNYFFLGTGHKLQEGGLENKNKGVGHCLYTCKKGEG